MFRAPTTLALTALMFTAAGYTAYAETKAAPEKPVSPAEAKVRQVVEQHIDGIVNADIEKLNKSWDTKTGKINFVAKNRWGRDVVHTSPITDSFKLWTESKIRGTRGDIQSIDVVNDKMAMVKAKVTWKGQVFDDYLVLLNTDDGWRLVSKTYTSKSAAPYYGG